MIQISGVAVEATEFEVGLKYADDAEIIPCDDIEDAKRAVEFNVALGVEPPTVMTRRVYVMPWTVGVDG